MCTGVIHQGNSRPCLVTSRCTRPWIFGASIKRCSTLHPAPSRPTPHPIETYISPHLDLYPAPSRPTPTPSRPTPCPIQTYTPPHLDLCPTLSRPKPWFIRTCTRPHVDLCPAQSRPTPAPIWTYTPPNLDLQDTNLPNETLKVTPAKSKSEPGLSFQVPGMTVYKGTLCFEEIHYMPGTRWMPVILHDREHIMTGDWLLPM